jgi:sulfotransferase famil protein
MKLYNREKPLISIHVPKCGGTSFRAVLQQWFGPNLYRHYVDERLNQMPCRHQLRAGICIHGHFNKKRNIGVMNYYPEADQFITILRDPFEMAVSRYFYAKGKGANRFRDGRPVGAMRQRFPDVKAYLQNGRKKCYLGNFLPYEVTLDNYEEMFDKDFVYVGITEALQTSVDTLAKKLGVAPIAVGRLNLSTRDEEVTAEIREEFVAHHPLEYAIYNYAVRHHNQ